MGFVFFFESKKYHVRKRLVLKTPLRCMSEILMDWGLNGKKTSSAQYAVWNILSPEHEPAASSTHTGSPKVCLLEVPQNLGLTSLGIPNKEGQQPGRRAAARVASSAASLGWGVGMRGESERAGKQRSLGVKGARTRTVYFL